MEQCVNIRDCSSDSFFHQSCCAIRYDAGGLPLLYVESSPKGQKGQLETDLVRDYYWRRRHLVVAVALLYDHHSFVRETITNTHERTSGSCTGDRDGLLVATEERLLNWIAAMEYPQHIRDKYVAKEFANEVND